MAEQNDELDQLNQRIRGNAPDTGGIQLPFSTLYIHWKNGDPKLIKVGGVDAFGGWETSNADDIDAVSTAAGITLPEDWERSEGYSQGKTFSRYTTRSLLVAYIAHREFYKNEKQTSGRYVAGWQQRRQTLVMLGEETPQGVALLMPAMLTVSGYNQIKYLNTAFQEWSDKTSAARKKISPNADGKRNFFLRLGTFGDKPEVIGAVGKNGKSTDITPLRAQYEVTDGFVRGHFVKIETLRDMARLSDEAKAWLGAMANKRPQNTPEAPEENPESEFSE